jgi:hypothetical protein
MTIKRKILTSHISYYKVKIVRCEFCAEEL